MEWKLGEWEGTGVERRGWTSIKNMWCVREKERKGENAKLDAAIVTHAKYSFSLKGYYKY